jgi:hypothetical protein
MDSMAEPQKQQIREMQKQGWTLEEVRRLVTGIYVGLGGLVFLAAIITILGSVQMMRLKSYGLAVTGAILAAIPGPSLLGCCCVGAIVGIWALVVLMNSDVKAAFR